MLSRVNIENYRGFRSFQMEGLATVNLIVGKNNSGKTALLESIHFLASGGDPSILIGIANRRGEFILGTREEPRFPDISHFFYGHNFSLGTAFSVSGGNDDPKVNVEVSLLEEDLIPKLFDASGSFEPALELRIHGARAGRGQSGKLVISEDGALLLDPRRPRFFFEGNGDGPSMVFISPDAGASESLGAMWNLVLRDKREDEVRSAMQILENDLEDIVFQTGERTPRNFRFPDNDFSRAAVLVSFTGDKSRIPLGSMGDGMRRLLALSLSLIQADGGYLFIDEIDTGFHYSIMAKMWELVVRTAAKSNIQVFATTHSADCVRGLGLLCKEMPALQSNVAAHKVERELDNSVLFTGDEVLNAVKQDIEIR